MKEFEELIGLDFLKALHVNDSKVSGIFFSIHFGGEGLLILVFWPLCT